VGGDGDAIHLGGESGDGHVPVRSEDQVVVNLVGEDGHVVAQADVGDPLQLLPPPDPAHRVVGVAQDQELGIARLRLQIVEVNGVDAVALDEAILQKAPLVDPDRPEERVIDRRLKDDPVPLGRQCLQEMADGGHHAGGEKDTGGIHRIAMAAGPPVHDGLGVLRGLQVIPVDAVGHQAAQGGGDALRHAEVHVGDPERQEIGPTIPLLQIVVLGGIGVATRDDLVEVRQHACLLRGMWRVGAKRSRRRRAGEEPVR
jgi:hypothetical protein